MQFAAVLLALMGAFGTAMPAPAQSDPRTALLQRGGWDAVTAGQLDVAAEAFRQAVAADPRNAQPHLGVATVAFLQHRDDDARSELEKALSIDPKLTRAQSLLGNILYRSGDLSGAIRVFDALTSELPDDKDARSTLDRWQRELDLQQRMRQQVGDHFAVSFEGPAEEALAAKAIESLDRAYWRIGAVLNVYPNASIPVVLYTTQQFKDITRSPDWAAGAYDGIIRVPMRGALVEPRRSAGLPAARRSWRTRPVRSPFAACCARPAASQWPTSSGILVRASTSTRHSHIAYSVRSRTSRRRRKPPTPSKRLCHR